MVHVPATNTEIPINTLLERIADHLNYLANTLAFTESAVSKHIGNSLLQDLKAFQEVQKLDYLQQSIADTAALLTSLSHGHRSEQALVDTLKLEKTRILVCCESAREDAVASPSFDLF